MAYLKAQIYEQSKLIFGLNSHKYLLENWKCYIGDHLILCTYTLVQLIEFKNLINSMNNNVNFTMEYSKTHLPFLDILMNNRDIIHIFTVSTQILNNTYSSFHPKHTNNNNILFNLSKCVCTNVSNFETRNKILQERTQVLLKKGYPFMSIEKRIELSKAIHIGELRKRKSVPDASNNIPFIATNNPRNTANYNIIHQNIPQ